MQTKRKVVVPRANIKYRLVKQNTTHFFYRRKDGSILKIPKHVLGVDKDFKFDREDLNEKA